MAARKTRHDPLLARLAADLPEPGLAWPTPTRREWLDACRAVFLVMYPGRHDEIDRWVAAIEVAAAEIYPEKGSVIATACSDARWLTDVDVVLDAHDGSPITASEILRAAGVPDKRHSAIFSRLKSMLFEYGYRRRKMRLERYSRSPRDVYVTQSWLDSQ